MDTRGNGGATGYLNNTNPGFSGPVGVQTPRQVAPFNGVNTSALLASQGTTVQQLQLQQQLRSLDLQRQQLLQQQYQQRSASGGASLHNAALSQQFASRPQQHFQMGQDQLLSQRLQQQAAQAALARGRTSPQHFLGRTSGGMVSNQLGNLSARSASNASGSSIDNIVRLLSSQQSANGLNAVGSQAPSSHIQSLLGRRAPAATPGVNAQLLQTLAAARNNPVLTTALQSNLSNLNNFNAMARPNNNAASVQNAQNVSTVGKQALLQQVLAAVQAQCSQGQGQGARALPGGTTQIGNAQSAHELLIQLGVCFARLGISVDAAIKAGLLGGLGAQDIRLLAEAHASENRKLNPSVDLSSQLSGLGQLNSVSSVSSDLGGAGTASSVGTMNPQVSGAVNMPGNRNAPKLSVMQMAASMDLDGIPKGDENGLPGMGMLNSGELTQLLRSNFGSAEYQKQQEGVVNKVEQQVGGLLSAGEGGSEGAMRAQSEVLLADTAKFDSNAYAFFGDMNGDGEELGGLEDEPLPLEEPNTEPGLADKADTPLDQVLQEGAGVSLSEPAEAALPTPRNEDKVIQFGPKPSLLLVAEPAKVQIKEDKCEKDNVSEEASVEAPAAEAVTAKKTSHTITDEDLYERFQDIGIGFE